MTLTPQDIQTQQFHVRFRGFDVDEVDSFLEKVAEELLALQEENKILTAKIEDLSKEVITYHTQEKTFQNAILSAQNIAEEMKEKSRQEAEIMLAKALEDAKQIREEANAETEKLEKEIERLKELRSQVKDDLRQFLQDYIERIDKEPEDVAATPAIALSEEPLSTEDDMPDLYEKIDLPDDLLGASPTAEASDDEQEEADDSISEEDNRVLAMDDEQEDDSSVPDIDGDFVFTLEDPLEDDEPTVNLGEDDEEEGFGKKQGVGS